MVHLPEFRHLSPMHLQPVHLKPIHRKTATAGISIHQLFSGAGSPTCSPGPAGGQGEGRSHLLSALSCRLPLFLGCGPCVDVVKGRRGLLDDDTASEVQQIQLDDAGPFMCSVLRASEFEASSGREGGPSPGRVPHREEGTHSHLHTPHHRRQSKPTSQFLPAGSVSRLPWRPWARNCALSSMTNTTSASHARRASGTRIRRCTPNVS